jgi:hypothetical protein
MGRVRINFNQEGLGNTMFNNILNAFEKENGYHAEAYDGYYKKLKYWESELSGWLSVKGFPCLMYSERKDYPPPLTTVYNPIGVEMSEEIATAFIITWS